MGGMAASSVAASLPPTPVVISVSCLRREMKRCMITGLPRRWFARPGGLPILKRERSSGMRWDDIDRQVCSVARALSVVGERWTLLILRDAFFGTRRFDQFQASLGITRHRLSERLGKLVDHGVLRRVRYSERPVRHEYRLTRKGLALYPVLMTLGTWGDDWMDRG